MPEMESRANFLYSSQVVGDTQHEASHLAQVDSSSTSFLRSSSYQRARDDDRNTEKLSRPSGTLLSIMLDILLCIIALCFLALAGLAVWMKDRPTGTMLGSRLEEVMKLGPTIYPIIFAALLSRSLKNIGRYMAQKGTILTVLLSTYHYSHLGRDQDADLEDLLVFMDLDEHKLGIRLLISCIYDTKVALEFRGLRYWDNGPLGNLYAYEWVWVMNDGAYSTLSMRDIYTAGLMQGTKAKAGPLDQFGNVKIPRLPDANTSDEDSDGWFPIARGDRRPEEYTSLFGIPIIGLSELNTAKVEFSIETSYVEVSCPKVEYDEDVGAPPGMNITCLDCGWPLHKIHNFIERTNSFLGPPFPELTAAQRANASYSQPRTILFNSSVAVASAPNGMAHVACPITQRLVEVFIECTKDDCATTKIRPSRVDHRGANFTSFDFWAKVVLDMISQASHTERRAEQVSTGTSTSELFLNNSEVLPLQQANNLFSLTTAETMNLSTVSAELYSARASILLNTGLQVFMCPTGFEGNFSTNLTQYGPDHTPVDGITTALNKSSWSLDDVLNGGVPGLGDNVPFIAASTNATVTRHIEIYLPNYVWVAFLAISATFLFLMGLIGLCLRFATMAPNVFDPVMGLTYGNKYMPPASRQSPLDAEERFKVLADERIRLGYVDGNDMIAKVVFGEESRVVPLSGKMRYY